MLLFDSPSAIVHIHMHKHVNNIIIPAGIRDDEMRHKSIIVRVSKQLLKWTLWLQVYYYY